MFKRLWNWIRRKKKPKAIPPELDIGKYYSKELLEQRPEQMTYDLYGAYLLYLITPEKFEEAKERGVQKVEIRRWKPLERGEEDAE